MKNMKKVVMILAFITITMTMVFAGGGAEKAEGGPVTIEFMQWWAPEMGEEKFQKLIDDFEAANPDVKVKVISLPYSEVLNQVTVGSATGTIADVIGVSPSWVYTLAKQGAIVPLDSYITDAGLDGVLVDVPDVDGKQYNIQVVTYIYPFFYNIDMLKAAGYDRPPRTWSEFEEYAEKVTVPAQNQYALAVPLSLDAPNGVGNDFFPWIWSTGGNGLKDGKPNFETPVVEDTLSWFNDLYQAGYISPGTLSKKEQEKVEEFANGRVAMLNTSMAHIKVISERNPDLNFDIATIPSPDGYTGKPTININGWNLSITENSKNKEAAWRLVEFLLDEENNAYLAANANAFPGNVNVGPEFIKDGDEAFAKAYEMFQSSRLLNEFYGTPNTMELQRLFALEMHKMLEGDQTPAEAASNAQASWEEIYNSN